MKISKPTLCTAVVIAAAILATGSSAASFSVYTTYSSSSCDGVPQAIHFEEDDPCSESQSCTQEDSGNVIVYIMKGCTNNYASVVASAFGSSPHLITEVFDDDDDDDTCTRIKEVDAFLADGTCAVEADSDHAKVITIDSSGTVVVTSYDETDCTGSNDGVRTLTSADLNVCKDERISVIGSADSTTGSTTTTSTPTTATTTNGSTTSSAAATTTDHSASFSIYVTYSSSSCDGIPDAIHFDKENSCSASQLCTQEDIGGVTAYTTRSCVINYGEFLKMTYASSAYLVKTKYDSNDDDDDDSNDSCNDVDSGYALRTNGSCVLDAGTDRGIQVSVASNGTMAVTEYSNGDCSGSSRSNYQLMTSDFNVCKGNEMWMFYTASAENNTTTSNRTGSTSSQTPGNATSSTHTDSNSAAPLPTSMSVLLVGMAIVATTVASMI